MSKKRLLEAVRRLDLAAVRALLDEQPALLHAKDKDLNLLHIACSVSWRGLGVPASRSVRLVTLLLDRGLDVESTLALPDCRVNSVWFASARAQNPELVKFLVKRGATPSGLFAAGWGEDIARLRLLLRLGADIDECVSDETPFLHCWKAGRFKSAEFLLGAGANVNFQDSRGKTALHYALEKAYEPTKVRLLMRHGASPDLVDDKGVSATQKASRKRNQAYRAALLQPRPHRIPD